MSLLGEFISDDTGMARKKVEHVEGDLNLANKRMAQFRQAYGNYVVNTAHSSPGPTTHATFAFDNGDVMHIHSQGGTDYVTIKVNDKPKEPVPTFLEGFLITPMKRNQDGEITNEPDYEAQKLYRFRFDLYGFANRKAVGKFAGNRRRRGSFGTYFSWDSAGGGDIIPETEENLENSNDPEAPQIRNPNAFATPFTALSGTVYHDGDAYPVLNGQIYGMRVYGKRILLADFPDTSTVRIHEAKVRFSDGVVRKIEYIRVLGTAPVRGIGVVNFSKYLSLNTAAKTFSTKCAVLGETVLLTDVALQQDAPPVVFTTEALTAGSGAEIVRSGFKDAPLRPDSTVHTDTLQITLRMTTKTGAMNNVSPHSAYEYGQPNSEMGPISTSGRVEYKGDYFELNGSTDTSGVTPAWSSAYNRQNFSSIIKTPQIVFQGIQPVVVYAWLRTISITSINDTNKLYWYLDYDTGSYVRLAWSVGYSATVNYEAYGIPEPVVSSLSVGKALNVGGNVVMNGSSTGNWFYIVTNDQGDYVLRTAPNGQLSDALLVAKNGITRVVKDTYSVGII